MRTRLSVPRPPGFLKHLLTFLEKQDLGMCFSGSGWNTDAEYFAGFGAIERFDGRHVNEAIAFCEHHADYLFCHLSYDTKNHIEALHTQCKDHMGFPMYSFFVPALVIEVQGETVDLLYHPHRSSEEEVRAHFTTITDQISDTSINAQLGKAFRHIHKSQYLRDIGSLKQHIQRGDVYQGNYCQEFLWEKTEVNGDELFGYGFERMPNPFSVFYRNGQHSLLSFSPERFLRFEGNSVTSQPMKGTAPRHDDPAIDLEHKMALRNSEKDRRENVMIVDLVRNDLSRYAVPGSVIASDLYTIETYPRVHQMHSTVRAEMRSGVHPLRVLLGAFPMGSMTGAPKIRAMQILDELEHSRRGVYSGTVGFFKPNGDGDFNVIIRSLVVNKKDKLLSCHAGGGITALSDPEAEYEESLVKARPIFDLVEEYFDKFSSALPLTDEAETS
ncbi:MAG: anthranilate synthase component I family protein [Cryomorphaceae bacterium]